MTEPPDAPAYRHLLLAVDLAPDSEAVGRRALQLARACGARLSIVHVVDTPALELSSDLMLAPPLDADIDLVAAAHDQLRDYAARLGLPEAQRHVAAGPIQAEVIRIAREQHADLIVLGSHQRHGLALLLGSPADAILHGAPCDLLAVRI